MKYIKYTNKLSNRSREWIAEQIRKETCHFREIHNDRANVMLQMLLQQQYKTNHIKQAPVLCSVMGNTNF